MQKQFIVFENDINKRKDFYDYINNRYNLDICYPYIKDYFIKSKYPFVVDFTENKFWICESITCLACASQSGKIITINNFIEQSN